MHFKFEIRYISIANKNAAHTISELTELFSEVDAEIHAFFFVG